MNLAARLCDEAEDGQILISRKTRVAAEDQIETDELDELNLKGFREPVPVFCLKKRV